MKKVIISVELQLDNPTGKDTKFELNIPDGLTDQEIYNFMKEKAEDYALSFFEWGFTYEEK